MRFRYQNPDYLSNKHWLAQTAIRERKCNMTKKNLQDNKELQNKTAASPADSAKSNSPKTDRETDKKPLSQTWSTDSREELEDWIEEQGYQLRF